MLADILDVFNDSRNVDPDDREHLAFFNLTYDVVIGDAAPL